ncbi:alginate lyase family protein [Spirosoma endbachense]|uniref:Heparinase n=1 Tax=Spirosoma endbachense TaxID=2666025 RepID=A0A6P1W708_9BACT|nr:alginate lyase family protein [Spirosoma endbachense]QHV99700.1 heparinase [Spirosoma endbachense]
MSKIGLIWRTVRYLRVRQIAYQLVNRLRKRPKLRLPKQAPIGYFLVVPEADKPVSYTDRTFTFLNQPVLFASAIDWNYVQNGKLWTYNLNYFDYLNQTSPCLTTEEGQRLIHEFITHTDSLSDGLEPYPTSLRIINWIQFLSRHQVRDNKIEIHLFAQIDLVNKRLEYHLAGNHLLENGFALLLGALYFQQEHWFRRASKLLRQELTIQILADGAHDERSPMYHQLLLDRLLDVLIALQANSWHNDASLVEFLAGISTKMLDWLKAITFSNGDVPMVNDAAFGIAPTSAQILVKAQNLPFRKKSKRAEMLIFSQTDQDSGYRMYRWPHYELFVDAGAVGPDHQPGHAHADTFSFVLYVDGTPVIVDSGTSTYQIGSRRAWERSTAAHNTVEISAYNSSEVWGGFRVGRRAHVAIRRESDVGIAAHHDGYRSLGITHVRNWEIESLKFSILDRIIGHKVDCKTRLFYVARLHFHPDVLVRSYTDHVIAGPIELRFLSDTTPKLVLKPYSMADGFNRLRSGHCLEITFTNYLHTIVTHNE